ncbi:MAG: response regulator [Magnetococcales bacterium]|nr:response regulator [Magnetococcales bacterium]
MSKDFHNIVLIVDDDDSNREILEDSLEDEGYQTSVAKDGDEALEMLQSKPQQYGTVLLDRMMPKMNGMEVLRSMKKDEELCRIPVILQTANALLEERLEGMRAGAWQYITKPFEIQEVLVAVNVAMSHYRDYKSLEKKVEDKSKPQFTMTAGSYEIISRHDIHDLASTLSLICPDPGRVLLGLVELINNAIEHGNLGITYAEKKEWLKSGTWDDNFQKRLRMDGNAEKKVCVDFKLTSKEVQFNIRDEGNGFKWKDYMDFDSKRALDPNGRGIAMARAISFDKIDYSDSGNEVIATIDI